MDMDMTYYDIISMMTYWQNRTVEVEGVEGFGPSSDRSEAVSS